MNIALRFDPLNISQYNNINNVLSNQHKYFSSNNEQQDNLETKFKI